MWSIRDELMGLGSGEDFLVMSKEVLSKPFFAEGVGHPLNPGVIVLRGSRHFAYKRGEGLVGAPLFAGVEFDEGRAITNTVSDDNGRAVRGGFKDDHRAGVEETGDDHDVAGGIEGCGVYKARPEVAAFEFGGSEGGGVLAAHKEEDVCGMAEGVDDEAVTFAFLDVAEIAEDEAVVIASQEFSAGGAALFRGGEGEFWEGVGEEVLFRGKAVDAGEFAAEEFAAEEQSGVRIPAAVAFVFRVEDDLLLGAVDAGTQIFSGFEAVAFVGDAGEEVALEDVGKVGDLGLVGVDDVELPVADGLLNKVSGGQPLDGKTTRGYGKGQPLDVRAEGFIEPLRDDGDLISGFKGNGHTGGGDPADSAIGPNGFEDVAERRSRHTLAGLIGAVMEDEGL